MDYEYLSRLVGGAGPGGHARAGPAARAAVPAWAISAMRGVADFSRPVLAVRHPLGFTCLPVERAGWVGVCVHLWSDQVDRAAPTTSQVHAHCWELTSYALFGRLENRIMAVADAGGSRDCRDEPGLHRVLEVRSEGGCDELVPTPRLVHCAPGRRQVIAAGDVYSVPAGAFHVTHVPPGTEAATVALGRLVPGTPDWSLGPPGSLPHHVRRQQCDPGQTAAVARIILGRLLAATPCPA